MITATYPGTFDPLTNGHLDLIRRACWIFPKLIVAVAESKRKHTLFTLEERVQMAKEAVKGFPNVEVVGFKGLLVDFVRRHGSTCIVRGAAPVSDFEYEFQMAGMNQNSCRKLKRSSSRRRNNFSSSAEHLSERSP